MDSLINLDEELNVDVSYRDRVKSRFKKHLEKNEITSVISTKEFQNPVEEADFNIDVVRNINDLFSIDQDYQNCQKLSLHCEEDAKKSESSAQASSEISSGVAFFANRKAITALQKSQMETSSALTTMTKLQNEVLKFQEKIMQALKTLYALGTLNIVANRSVYRRLEQKLKGASKNELSDFAKKEVLNVMQQLNDQQDIFIKQKKLEANIREEHENREKDNELLRAKISFIEGELEKLKNDKEKEINDNSSGEDSLSTEDEKTLPKKEKSLFKKLFGIFGKK